MEPKSRSAIGRRRVLAMSGAAGALSLSGCSLLGETGPSNSDLLAEAAIPLETVEPADSTDDLAPLAETLADKTIIGLGEATHGTKEFFQAKHRLLRFLVTELDVRVFAWEDSFGTTRQLNEYIHTGDGNPRHILNSVWFLEPWETESVVAMVEWLRSYNEGRDPDDKVSFYGFDAQLLFTFAEPLTEYVDRAGLSIPGELEDDLDDVSEVNPRPATRTLETAESVVERLRDELEANKEQCISATSEAEWERAKRDLWSMERAITQHRVDGDDSDGRSGFEIRDESMAENVSWILSHEDADQMAIWAHNGHVRKGPLRSSRYVSEEFTTGEEPPLTTMGSHLASEFGDEYYALGFEFGYGSYRTPIRVTVDEVASHREFAAAAVDLNESAFAVDFESVSEGDLLDFLDGVHYLYTAGWAVPESVETVANRYDLREELDGLLFVEESSPTTAL